MQANQESKIPNQITIAFSSIWSYFPASKQKGKIRGYLNKSSPISSCPSMLDVVVLLEQEKASLGFQFHPFFAPLAFVWPSFFAKRWPLLQFIQTRSLWFRSIHQSTSSALLSLSSDVNTGNDEVGVKNCPITKVDIVKSQVKEIGTTCPFQGHVDWLILSEAPKMHSVFARR